MKKILSVLSLLVLVFSLASCNRTIESSTSSDDKVSSDVDYPKDDLTKKVDLTFNYATGNADRTMTYNKTPLDLGGKTYTTGDLKPVWQELEEVMNSKFTDNTAQTAKASDMIATAAANGFSEEQIYGGNSIADSLMSYGTQGKFVALDELIAKGQMPNFGKYLEENPDIKAAITAYDGHIYHIPYAAEVGNYARAFNLRETWVTDLLDKTDANYDTNVTVDSYYEGVLTGSNARTGSNGGTVTPKEGTNITKKTSENIITIQNNLSVKNGATLTEALIKYINDNYDYTNPSELFLGDKAAYDIDELVALFRAIKGNASYLTDGQATDVYPFFTRKGKYREDTLRLATYFTGAKAHGSDSYAARWYIDAEGTLQYTYDTEDMYDTLGYLSDLVAEGLIRTDCLDDANKTDFRSEMWGHDDDASSTTFGFMTFDWIASSTSDSLNDDTVVVLPPVAKVNDVWQYYIDNSRAIKPDGWSISVAGTNEEQELRAASLFDYFFTEEGNRLQNYGLDANLKAGKTYKGPDGVMYPEFNDVFITNAQTLASGDYSKFCRDWIGALIPVGFQKEIGFEYQYTSQRGFDGWALLQNSTTTFPTYSGANTTGTNKNYKKLIPPVFSLAPSQSEALSTSLIDDSVVATMFNIVLYKTLDNAPAGTDCPMNYTEYKKMFTDKGIETYVQIYQSAYAQMQA